MRARNPIAWCAIDTLCCLLLVIYVMVAPPPKKNHTPSIPTYGQYAVVLTWPASRDDDIDLHVVSPDGFDVYFASNSSPTMYLEHDNIPLTGAPERSAHHERIVINGTMQGEYIVNTHFYDQQTSGPCPVTVTLYQLRGNDREVMTEHYVLDRETVEHTAFRFKLNRAGDLVGFNHLQRKLIL